MTIFNQRLISGPFLNQLIAHADELADLCNQLADPAADYEAIDQLPRSERADAREACREAIWELLGEIKVTAEQLLAMRDRLEVSIPDTLEPAAGEV